MGISREFQANHLRCLEVNSPWTWQGWSNRIAVTCPLFDILWKPLLSPGSSNKLAAVWLPVKEIEYQVWIMNCSVREDPVMSYLAGHCGRVQVSVTLSWYHFQDLIHLRGMSREKKINKIKMKKVNTKYLQNHLFQIRIQRTCENPDIFITLERLSSYLNFTVTITTSLSKLS